MTSPKPAPPSSPQESANDRGGMEVDPKFVITALQEQVEFLQQELATTQSQRTYLRACILHMQAEVSSIREVVAAAIPKNEDEDELQNLP